VTAEVSGWDTAFRSTAFEHAALSVHAARVAVLEVCAGARVSTDAIETAQLLVSELVTNAITHGAGPAVVDIDVRAARLRVTVKDDGAGRPQVRRHHPVLAEGGRGLHLVEMLAARWGTSRRVPSGKSVWFELDHG
jgi:anti-sigma regulatory factor (Ser/Thr protein kinase)